MGAGEGQGQRGLRAVGAGGWGRLGKSRLSLLGGGGRHGGALAVMREGGGSRPGTAAVPSPAACPGAERPLCSLPLKGKRNTYAWQISPKMYFSKTPNCLTRPAAAGKFQGAGGGGVFGVTLRDRERWWGERGHRSFPPLLSESHSRRRAQLGRARGSGKPPPVVERETEAQRGGWWQRKG